MTGKSDLIEHFKTGAATTCRAWTVTRKDKKIFGFTDHDRDLSFDGIIFKANSGMTAGAMQKSTGMAVDNTEIVGALQDDAISEVDLSIGRFDGAEVVIWLLNWTNVEQRTIRFRGNFGEIKHSAGSFRVELRGLSEVLNQAKGRIYQPNCPAHLGDKECRFNLNQPGFAIDTVIKSVGPQGTYVISSQPNLPENWFARGRTVVLSGAAAGLDAMVKFDSEVAGGRKFQLWIDFALPPQIGDEIRFEPGCDKLAGTCRSKFNNFINFRGFPNMPGSDWVTSYPVSSQRNDGGSRQK